ncbi:MAG: ComEA family DNA-binding protein [Cyanobacteria bacterium P01_F01_bin.4]
MGSGKKNGLGIFLAKQVLKALDRLEAGANPLRVRLQQDPYYRFQSVAEIEAAVALGVRIDANQATVDDWLRLPGISIHQGRTLVQLTRSGVALTCIEDVAAAIGVSVQRLQPLVTILVFCYYDSAIAPETVNVNQANLAQLTRIPAIDTYLARAIIDHRQHRGPYHHLADLQQRLQLSGQLTAALLHYLRF